MLRGFTLIELLIVVGILAILATTVVLVLNPAEFLRQARDSQRLSDLDTIKGALSLYLARTSSVDLDGPNFFLPSSPGCTVNWWADVNAPLGRYQPFRTPASAIPSVVLTTPRATDGNGWVPVDLTDANVFTSQPLSKLPIDPAPDITNPLAPQNTINDATGRYYAYTCDQTAKTFEIVANMESAKFSCGTACGGAAGSGSKDVESTDGGLFACSGPGATAAARCSPVAGIPKAYFVYQIGNDPGLDL